ncbi:hypothetical protein BDP81DRAFT_435950 [Colletotrichum phormii]|uniref:Uncharacterized protein n=1 Tax=Colletotrichum phormii TaxID=359342 RepID=A0AAJ0EDE2_9PEZI|nr:uncharacterized protein BDP81DRAFT_435950 [Colletotrichum phormii]KAK1625502.1 hypothetical protein BDP81DRAFT_435950 [Colletotrichum phormii]
MPQGSQKNMTGTARRCRCIRPLGAGAGARATCKLWQGVIYGFRIKRQAGAGESRTAGAGAGGKKGQEGRRDSRQTRDSIGSSSPNFKGRKEPLVRTGLRRAGQYWIGTEYGRLEAGGGPHLQHRTCPAPVLHLTPGTHALQERWPVSGPPPASAPASAPTLLLAPGQVDWLLLCCYGLLLDGWVPRSFLRT